MSLLCPARLTQLIQITQIDRRDVRVGKCGLMGCHTHKFLVPRHRYMCEWWSVPVGHQLTHGVPQILGDELLPPTCYANIWGNIAELTVLAAFRGSTQKVELLKKKKKVDFSIM